MPTSLCGSIDHVAIAVVNREEAASRLFRGDLDGARENLRQGGAAPDIDIVEDDGIRQDFLYRDPGSGVRIELIERRGGTFNERSMQTMFRAFEDKDLY